MDLVAAMLSGLAVLWNNGNGAFTPGEAFAAGDFLISVAAGELNDDEHPDLVAAHAAAGAVSVHLNKGDGTFATAVSYDVGHGPDDLVLEDMNGDFALDMAVVNANSDDLSVLLNDGGGTTPRAFNPMSIAIGDLNGDAAPDVALGHETVSAGAELTVLLNEGRGVSPPISSRRAATASWGSPDLLRLLHDWGPCP